MVAVFSWIWIVLLLVVQPLLAFRGRHRVAERTDPRMRLYLGSAAGIALIGLISLGLDVAGDRYAVRSVLTGRIGEIVGWSLMTAVAMLALWLAIQWARKEGWEVPTPGYVHLLPRTGAERVMFAGLSVIAGVGEEFAFRGLALGLLAGATGSVTVAAVIVTVAFGLGHAYQGPSGVIRTGLAGTVLVIPVLATGALIPSIVGHAVLDLLSGLATRRVLQVWGVLGPD